jgi:hypothetical protein
VEEIDMVIALSVFFLALVFIPSVRRVLSWGFGLLFAAAVYYAWCILGAQIWHFRGVVMSAWAFIPFVLAAWISWYQVKGWLRRRRAGKS